MAYFFVLEYLLVHKLCKKNWSKQILGPRKIGENKILVSKNFGEKDFWGKNIKKIILVQKIIDQNKPWQKKLWKIKIEILLHA